jgi:ubiquitin carboxyl-terminal hydrolase 5/13
MKALSSAQQSEVKAWEEEILPCEHTLTLQQEPLIIEGDRKL